MESVAYIAENGGGAGLVIIILGVGLIVLIFKQTFGEDSRRRNEGRKRYRDDFDD